MSCTHDCGCTPETRDARTDEWVQIAPESARAATLTPEQPVKAPGQGEYSQSPSEPVLPRQVAPEDVRPGMVIETRTQWEATSRIIDGRFEAVESSGGVCMGRRCEVWLIEDAPAPVDPDAELVERMAEAMWRIEEKPPTDYAGAVDDPEGWQELAHAALKALRETHDVTARAEQ